MWKAVLKILFNSFLFEGKGSLEYDTHLIDCKNPKRKNRNIIKNKVIKENVIDNINKKEEIIDNTNKKQEEIGNNDKLESFYAFKRSEVMMEDNDQYYWDEATRIEV